jgi:hypothetical protein
MLDAIPLFLLLTTLAWVALGAVTLKRVKQARELEPPSAQAAHPYTAAVLGNMGIPARFINRRSLYDRWRETWIGPKKSPVRVTFEPATKGPNSSLADRVNQAFIMDQITCREAREMMDFAEPETGTEPIEARPWKRKTILAPDGQGGWREVDVTTTADLPPR